MSNMFYYFINFLFSWSDPRVKSWAEIRGCQDEQLQRERDSGRFLIHDLELSIAQPALLPPYEHH